jgi:SAM-dependent methyltransferase
MSADPATTWGVGEYELIAQRLEPAADAIVELADVGADDRVLDVACGTGNAALLAAGRGAVVTGLDIEPRLLEIAHTRARAAALDVRWVCDHVERTMLDGATFSVVLSAFGVMYAPNHDAAAAALARFGTPAARVALAAWAPGSFMPAMGGALAPYLPPPPPGGGPPSRWGDAAAVAQLLEPHGLRIRDRSTSSLSLSFAGRDQAVDFLIRTAGHVRAEQQRLEREGRWQDLRRDLGELVATRDEGDGSRTELRCEYLLVLAERA